MAPGLAAVQRENERCVSHRSETEALAAHSAVIFGHGAHLLSLARNSRCCGKCPSHSSATASVFLFLSADSTSCLLRCVLRSSVGASRRTEIFIRLSPSSSYQSVWKASYWVQSLRLLYSLPKRLRLAKPGICIQCRGKWPGVLSFSS